MHLKQNTDYALRILMVVAQRPGQTVCAKEISDFHGISYSHVVKTVNKLGKLGYLALKRGRYGGGIRMACAPEEINIATVVQQFESHFDLVECFNRNTNACVIAGDCRLAQVFDEATRSFLGTLDGYTLADLLSQPQGERKDETRAN